MWPLISGAFVAGLVGSPHCVGMCGGFAGACAQPSGHAGAYHAGRLVTYAALGAIAGTLGHALPGPGWVLPVVAAVLTTVFALSLAGLMPAPKVALPGVHRAATAALRKGGAFGALGLGLATSLLPCGLVYAALGVPVALAHPGWGALAMVAFGLGTVPVLAGASVGLRRIVSGRLWARRALAVAVLAAAWWSIGMRATMAEAAADAPPAVGEDAPSCH